MRLMERDWKLIELNDSAEIINELIESCEYKSQFFVTYTFKQHFSMDYLEFLNRFMRFYIKTSQTLKTDILPLIYVAPINKKFHVHTIELDCKYIDFSKRKNVLRRCFREAFKKSAGFIEMKKFDSQKAGIHYCVRGHIYEPIKKVFSPRTCKRRQVPFSKKTQEKHSTTRLMRALLS